MATTIWGVVREGRVVPNSPLPEGAFVAMKVAEPPEVPPELQAEFDAWDRVSANALEIVERQQQSIRQIALRNAAARAEAEP